MAQPEYILKFGSRAPNDRLAQDDRIRASYRQVMKPGPDLGGIRFSEPTGKIDKGHICLRGDNRTPYGRTIAANAEGVKEVVRRLRPDDAERLDAIDAEIEALRQQIAEKRRERLETLRDAFKRGHVVRLAEVVAVAEKG